MYICICAQVRECEVRAAIAQGAQDELDVAEACDAGTGCGLCLDQIDGLLQEERNPTAA